MALFLVTAGAASPAVGQVSASPVEDFFGDDEDSDDDGGILSGIGSVLDAYAGAIAGYRSRVTRSITSKTGLSDDISAETAADDLQEVANDNIAGLQSYANDRVNAGTDYDVLELELTIDGETATRYATADVVNGSYENTSVVDSTDRSVDQSCTFEGAAARNAADELQSFIDNYVEPDKDVSEGLVSRITTEYGGKIDCSFI